MDCTEILKTLIPVAGAVVVAYLTYLFAVKKLKKVSRENIERKKYEAILHAHKKIYSLLAYTTDTENAKSILVWEAEKNDRANKTYYFRKRNALEFIDKLRREFYDCGNGLFLSSEVNKLIFEYRGLVYGFLLKEDKNTEECIKMDNPEMAKRMITINQEMITAIRESIGLQKREINSL